jgi:Phosphotransferase enzyme family
VRVHWDELPEKVRDEIEERLGGTVVEAVTQRGGFSPGLAARVRLADGRRAFVKAVSEAANPDSPRMHRREAQVVRALPDAVPVPRLLWTYDEGGWVALGFEDVDGRMPAQPWRDDELRLVVEALARLQDRLTPSPIESRTAGAAFERTLHGWSDLAEHPDPRLDRWSERNLGRLAELESRAPAFAAGETLIQFDVRADNILLAGDRVYFVDWPHARIGAPFVEWVAFAPSVAMQGGPEPEALFAMANLQPVNDEAINAVLCSLTGFFFRLGFQPPPPGLPTIRAFQLAQGAIALRWLRERTRWT